MAHRYGHSAVLLVLGLMARAGAAPEDGAVPQPHVILVLADDLGYSNLGFRRAENLAASGSEVDRQAAREVHSPRIDALRRDGILLERHYGPKICSPSRCSLQTGRLGVHVNARNTGVLVHNPDDPVSGFQGIPRDMTGVAQKLKDTGYQTAMVGKWDAGMATPDHTPWGRGFDQWMGYFQHANHYWNKRGTLEATGFLDLCLNRLVDLHEVNGTYRGGVLDPVKLESNCSSSFDPDPACYVEHIFKEQALRVLDDYADGQAAAAQYQPLFYMHSFHLVHTPLQVPNAYVNKVEELAYPHTFDDEARRNSSAMVLYMDDVVGLIVDRLHQHDMWKDSLVLFLVDNGGPLYEPGGVSNYPLKGGKYSDWEGGVRTPAIMSGGLVPRHRRGGTYRGVVSISDWYGVLCDLAGANWTDTKAALANARIVREGLDSPLLYPVESTPGILAAVFADNATNLTPSLQLSDQALLQWPFKLVTGPQPFTTWTGPLYPNCSTVHDDDRPPVPWMNDSSVFDNHFDWSNSKRQLHRHLWSANCHAGCLFNVEADPEERDNLAADPDHQQVLADMQAELAELNEGLFLPERGTDAPAACEMAVTNGGYYGPFVDAEDYYTGPLKEYTWLEQERNKAYTGLVNELAKPPVTEAMVELVQLMFPQVLRPRLEKTFDKCLLDADDE